MAGLLVVYVLYLRKSGIVYQAVVFLLAFHAGQGL